MYLIYNKLKDVEKNLDEIYVNMLEEYAEQNEGYIFNKNEKKKHKTKNISNQNKNKENFAIPGKNYKTKIENLDSGYTTAWDQSRNLTDGRFAIYKPKLSYMENISFDEELNDISHLLDLSEE